MKELMSIILSVLLPLSMAAALTVVFVAALETLRRTFQQATAVILALGVTILAIVGTAQIILVRSQPDCSVQDIHTLIAMDWRRGSCTRRRPATSSTASRATRSRWADILRRSSVTSERTTRGSSNSTAPSSGGSPTTVIM